jgi:hypothetical protein
VFHTLDRKQRRLDDRKERKGLGWAPPTGTQKLELDDALGCISDDDVAEVTAQAGADVHQSRAQSVRQRSLRLSADCKSLGGQSESSRLCHERQFARALVNVDTDHVCKTLAEDLFPDLVGDLGIAVSVL